MTGIFLLMLPSLEVVIWHIHFDPHQIGHGLFVAPFNSIARCLYPPGKTTDDRQV